MNANVRLGACCLTIFTACSSHQAAKVKPAAAVPVATQYVQVSETFAGPLGEGWAWLDEDQTAWKLGDGRLQMKRYAGKGFWGTNAKLPVLYRSKIPLRKGLEVQVKVGFDVDRPYGQAGLVLFYDNDRYAKFTLEYWYNLGTHVHFLREDHGVPCRCEQTCERATKLGKSEVELKLTYDGAKFITAYRLVGETAWTPHFEVDALENEGPINVGLFSQADWGSKDGAWFDDFQLRYSP